MASLSVDGLSELILDLEELANLPESVQFEMLEAGAKPVVQTQKRYAPKNTGTLAQSIVAKNPIKTKSGCKLDIIPQGIHHTLKGGKSKYRKRGKSGANVRNAEVGFIHEFGAKGRNIHPSNWMRNANEMAISQAISEEEKVYDNYLKSKNL